MSTDHNIALERRNTTTTNYAPKAQNPESDEIDSQIDFRDSKGSNHIDNKKDSISASSIIYDAGRRLLNAQLPQVSRDKHKLLIVIWSLGWYKLIDILSAKKLSLLSILFSICFFYMLFSINLAFFYISFEISYRTVLTV